MAAACAGNLDAVTQIKISVDVGCSQSFETHPKVADAASELLITVFGPYTGKPLRTAVGAPSLPNQAFLDNSNSMASIDEHLFNFVDMKFKQLHLRATPVKQECAKHKLKFIWISQS